MRTIFLRFFTLIRRPWKDNSANEFKKCNPFANLYWKKTAISTESKDFFPSERKNGNKFNAGVRDVVKRAISLSRKLNQRKRHLFDICGRNINTVSCLSWIKARGHNDLARSQYLASLRGIWEMERNVTLPQIRINNVFKSRKNHHWIMVEETEAEIKLHFARELKWKPQKNNRSDKIQTEVSYERSKKQYFSLFLVMLKNTIDLFTTERKNGRRKVSTSLIFTSTFFPLIPTNEIRKLCKRS